MAHRISNHGRSSRVTRPSRKSGRPGRFRALAFEPLESRVLLDAAGPLSGTVFEDLNENGVFDPGEPGLAGFEVELQRLGGHVRAFDCPDDFGNSVAIQGDRYLVGIPTLLPREGTVHLFDLATGEQLRSFSSPNPELDDWFAWSVAFVGDNVLVGAPVEGVEGDANHPFAYLFDGATGELLQSFTDPHANTTGRGPSSFSVAAVDNRILIGDYGDGAAYLFDATTGELLQTFPDSGPWGPRLGPRLGTSVAFLGDDVLTGSLDAIYLFDGDSGELLRTFAIPKSDDRVFGQSLAVSGTQILVGAPTRYRPAEGAAYLFDSGTGELLRTFRGLETGLDLPFGESVAFLGDDVLIGAPGLNRTAGAVYRFDADTGELLETFRSPLSHPSMYPAFGGAVAADGDYFLVGSNRSTGAGRAFRVHLFTTSASIPTSTRTATTDAEGNYRLDGLEPGTYVVSALLPAGYAQGDGSHTIVVGDGQGLSVLDFGAVSNNPPPEPEPAPVPEPGPTPEPIPPPRVVLPVAPGISAAFEFSGTVVYLSFEGGFYGIIGEDGGHYDPLALPAEFAQQDAQVRLVARNRADLVSFHQWGTIIELIDIQPGNPPAREEIPDVVDKPVPLPDSDLGLLPYDVVDWQLAGAVTPAPVAARALPEAWLYQGEGSSADRADVASGPSLAPVDAFFADFSDDFLPESEPARALPVDAVLHDWESETGWPLEIELEPGLSDFLLESEPGESAAPLL